MALNPVLADNRNISVLFPASLAVATNDLLFYDAATNTAKPASSRSDQGSLIANQADFAPLFLGVSADSRLAIETTSQRRLVDLVQQADVSCSSQTWKYGDLVAIDRDSGNSVNYNQQVAKVTNPALAIGMCIKDEPSAVTKVRVKFESRWCSQLALIRNRGIGGFQGTGSTALTDADTTLTPASNPILTGIPTAARKVILPPPALCTGFVFYVVNNSAGAYALNVRDNGDSATIQSVAQNKRGIFLCDGTTWFGVLGA